MKKYQIILSRILRKNKTQFICFTLIIFISSLFLNLGLSIFLNFDKSFENKWADANMPDAFFIVQNSDYTSEKQKKVENIDILKDSETRDCVYFCGSVTAGNGKDIVMPMVVYNRDDGHKYNNYKLISSEENNNENAAYVSYWFYADKGCRLGDTLEYKIGNETYHFVINGFVEDMQYGNNNCNGVALHLSDSNYRKFSEQVSDNYKYKSINLMTTDKSKSEDIYQSASQIITSNPDLKNVLGSGYYQQSIKFRTMMTDIVAAILVVFALSVTILSLFICGFRIRNSIAEDMQIIGILKSMGYKSRQIQFVTSLPYVLVCLVSSVVGIACSFLAFPYFCDLVGKLTGLLYTQGADPVAITATMAVLLLTVIITVALSTRKVKKYPPVVALDMGIEHHNFKHCYFPLEKTHLGLNSALGAKNFIGFLKQNVSMFFIMILITFVVMYAASAYYNLNINTQNFVYSVSEEYCNVIAETNGKAPDLCDRLDGVDGIEKAICYDINKVKFDGKEIDAFICNDFSKQNNNLIYNGRDPKHSNEIALGSAYDKKFSIGETVSISNGNKKASYLVVGFLQSPDYIGKTIELTSGGYSSISKDYKPNVVFIYLNKSFSADDCVKMLKSDYKDIVLNTSNNDKTMETSLGTYLSLVSVLVAVLIIAVSIIAVIVLFIIFSTIIIQRKKDFGILKAIGYTTGMLTFQTVFGILPSVILGTLSGCALGYFFMNDAWIAILESLEIRKCNLGIPLGITFAIAIIIILLSVLISVLMCRGLRKISANKLVSE